MSLFDEQYKKLNALQKDAVDSIEGPVMVVAGPGTGKTEILTLRIGNILKKTDTNPDSILCLTFTRSGVRAMKKRLSLYIGKDADKVKISTFHSFAIEIVLKYYELLGFTNLPKLIEEEEIVFLIDDILESESWNYLRPRNNPQMYFSDLKSLFSILKRERITVDEFENQILNDIKFLENDESSISSRGENKGKLKKEVEAKIESLRKTLEVVAFYRIYEERKKEFSLMDYDDVLEYIVILVLNHEDARADIYENYQYVLVDEHQDSSGIQNSFLKAVWGEIESPNIFVVGDDRQLIYAFSGAKLNYFEEFANYFGKTKLITLVDNYRSTEKILDLAHNLLQSTLSKEKLKSNNGNGEKSILREYNYDRDEILGAGLYFKKLLDKGESPSEMAILVPKNYHVTNAISILESLNLPVVNNDNKSLFNLNKTDSFLRILNILNNPFDHISISLALLDKTSKIPFLEAHKFLEENKNKNFNLETLINYNKNSGTLFGSQNSILSFGNNLFLLLNQKGDKLSHLISEVGNQFYINNSINHEDLLENVELVRTFIHLALLFETKKINPSLGEFIEYLSRLKQYKNHIAVATLNKGKGIEVMTLHKSKGLEYKYVWIAHMNEETVMSEKRNPFTLPEYVKERLAKRNIEDAKRELYVAITRAREFCNISYSAFDLKGSELTLSGIIKDLDEVHFSKKDKNENEEELLNNDINGAKIFTSSIFDIVNKPENSEILDDLNNFVKENYKDIKVSVSLLNNFFECPFKWYFRNFLKLPEVKSSSLALGSSVHNTIEFILKNQKIPNEKVIKDFIKESLQKEGVNNLKDLNRLDKEAFSIIENWIQDFYPNLRETFQSERSLSLREKDLDILIYGKLDLTERLEDGSIIITDFKTGKPKTKNEIEKFDEEGRMSPYMRQLAMYSYLVRDAEKGSNVELSKLLFLEADPKDKNKVYQTCINEEQIDLLKRDISDYVESLENSSWVERKCDFKPFGGKNEPCPHCTLAKNIFLK